MKQSWKAAVLTTAAALAVLVGGAPGAPAHEEDGVGEIEGILTVYPADRTVEIGGILLQVHEGTEIEIDDEVSFEELVQFAADHPGAEAEAEYLDLGGPLVATEIEVEADEDEDEDEDGGEDEDEDEEDPEDAEVSGILEGIDLSARTLTVVPFGSSTPVTFQVTGETELELNGAELSLALLAAAIQPGQVVPVEVEYVVGLLVALEIEVEIELPEATVEVVSVNAKKGLLTVQAVPAAAARSKRSKSARNKARLLQGALVLEDGRLVTPASIRRGDRLSVTFFANGKRTFVSRAEITQ